MFVDERDAGPLYITHFTLLLGLAVPIWVAAALQGHCGSGGSCGKGGGGISGGSGGRVVALPTGCDSMGTCELPLALDAVVVGLSGVMVIGLGDTAASVAGRAWGRVPMTPGSHKTLEGTLAAVFATLAGWWAVLAAVPLAAGAVAASGRLWPELLIVSVGACLLEACTSQLDNILIPLFYLPHCALTAA